MSNLNDGGIAAGKQSKCTLRGDAASRAVDRKLIIN